MSQLFFAIPKVFDADPTIETPNMIFDFDRRAWSISRSRGP